MASAHDSTAGTALNPCGCEGTQPAPAARGNRPGLPAIAYRTASRSRYDSAPASSTSSIGSF